MKKHLIALDLDGTLLTSTQTISDRNKRAIEKVRTLGHTVVIATGRPHRASIDYYHELGLDTPMVNFNGALLHHPTDKNWEALHSPLGLRTAKKIIQTCYEFEVNNIMAEVKDDVYLDRYDEEIMTILHTQKEEDPIKIGSLKNSLTSDPTSILIHPKDHHIEALRKRLDDDHADVIEHRRWGAPWNMIEIVREGMNKAVGLKRIAHYYHVDQANIIAFGDEDNDLEMLDYAGIGVKMANGNDCLNDVINETTQTNDDDGVACFLETYFELDKE
ncbi:MAG: Cof-type HAD-IIB family hydrolase [Bacillota bacterium]